MSSKLKPSVLALILFAMICVMYEYNSSQKLESRAAQIDDRGTPTAITSEVATTSNTSKRNGQVSLPKYRNKALSLQACQKIMSSSSSLEKGTTSVKELTLDEKEYLLLHIGKAGGGTLETRWKFIWDVTSGIRCHPLPCDEIFSPDKTTPLSMPLNPNTHHSLPTALPSLKSVFITIRDPIDRFVSAVNWRLTELCDPSGDNRTYHSQPWDKPDERCSFRSPLSSPRERHVLFRKYQRNVSLIAESLCSINQADNVVVKKNGEVFNADDDRRAILHTHSLGDWLGETTQEKTMSGESAWKTAVHKIVPVVQEKGFDFQQQIDDALQWIQENHSLENPIKFAKRKQVAQKRDCIILQAKSASALKPKFSNEVETLLQNMATARHTSQRQANRLKLSKHVTKRGEYCLARYYEDDYKLLQELKDTACKFESCRMAIQSILDRRKALLASVEQQRPRL